jgi:UPF0755 protein
MRRYLSLLLFIGLAWGQTKMDVNNLIDRGGVLYAPNNNKPYTGTVFDFYENGTEKLNGRYRNGLKNGKWTWWNRDGSIIERGTYRNELMNGLWQFYYWNDNMKVKGSYRDGNGATDDYYSDIPTHGRYGKWTYWYENGNKKLEGFFKNDERNGKWLQWYENGQKMGESSFKDGLPNGLTIVWNENGQKVKEATFEEGKELKKITFLEGWTIRQFADHLALKLDLEAGEIVSLANRDAFLHKHQINGSSAEGYLFPDTYLVSEYTDPESVLNILINEGRKFWTKAREYRATALGLTKHEILTMASIIEGEAIYDDERPIISAVYHNRLENGMRLQADPTIQYVIEDGPRRLLNRDLRINSPYNTYLHKGLPPGPINSPGKKSLLAALYPEENEYLFFVAKGDGYHIFSKTEKEHFRAKKKLQKLRKALKINIK